MVKIQRIFIGVLVALVLCLAGVMVYTGNYPAFLTSPQVTPDSVFLRFDQKTPLRVTVVSDGNAMARGLSGKTSLDSTEGMLFVFPENGRHGIWMKDMLFPIDIAWVDASGRVVSIEESVRPDTYPQVFQPVSPARFVIETNAYFMNSFNIRVGSTVFIPDEVLPAYFRK